MTPSGRTVLNIEEVPFGDGKLYVRSLTSTPYLVIADRERGPILALAVGPEGYVVHPAADVKTGAVLEGDVDPNEVRR
jgi:hypothetical protein